MRLTANYRKITRLVSPLLGVAALAVALLAPTAARASFLYGFEGTSQLDNCALNQCFRPPDTMGAVGTTQFLETTNGSITVYNKLTGAVLQRTAMPTFWANAGLPGGANGDQRVLFDHYTGRWIMAGFGATGNLINIAVSATADALGTWKSTQITALPSDTATADYPTLSLDDKGVYIGTNNFTPGFAGTSLFVIPKTSLFSGAPNTAGMTVINTPLSGPDNGFAIQAALNWQGNPTNTVSLVADSRDFNAQVFYRVSGVNGPGAMQTASSLIAGSAYDTTGPGRQPDGTRLIDTLSPRITANAVQYNGRIYSTTAVLADTSIGDFTAVRWNVVDAVTGALVSTGKVQQTGYDFYEGAISINPFGEVVMAYNRSGFVTADGNGDGLSDGNISFLARMFSIGGGGALQQEGAELLLRTSPISDYRCGQRTFIDTSCRQRWGDYAAVTFDPVDNHRFFAIGEYAQQWAVIPGFTTTPRAIFSTYIAAIGFGTAAQVPEPATLTLLGLGLAGLALVRRRKTR